MNFLTNLIFVLNLLKTLIRRTNRKSASAMAGIM